MKRRVQNILLGILCIICIGSLGYMIHYQVELKTEQEQVESLRQKKEVSKKQYEKAVVIQNEKTVEIQNEKIAEVQSEEVIERQNVDFVEAEITEAIQGQDVSSLDVQDLEITVQQEEVLEEVSEVNSFKNLAVEETEILNIAQATETGEAFVMEENNEGSAVDALQSVMEAEPEILPQYAGLYAENSDLVGWITIDGTVIDYPVMQKPGSQLFYSYRGWNKKGTLGGLPIVDINCSLDSNHLIIYAHKMRNGTMFGTLPEYRNEDYFREHPLIHFDTLYEEGEYQIIGVLLARAFDGEKPKKNDFVFYQYTNLSSEDEFDEYIASVKRLSLYDIPETAEYGDKLITLVTCYYYVSDGRILVVAKKIS